MKTRRLPAKTPIRSSLLPWKKHELLPPENPRRKEYSSATTVSDMPTKFTFVLVDLVAQDVKLSKGKARKAIQAGKVRVNGEVVHDPDMRVDADDKLEFFA